MELILMYKPPCGRWYVHSHKTYTDAEEGRAAARRFLHPGTEYALVPVDVAALDEQCELV